MMGSFPVSLVDDRCRCYIDDESDRDGDSERHTTSLVDGREWNRLDGILS